MKKLYSFIILAAAITMLFTYQHITTESWDFQSYVLNGEYWFANGSYFEPLRPPLMPFIIGTLGYLSTRAIAEFGFIILASTLFAFAMYRLGKKLNFDPLLFYALSCTPFILTTGLVNGTELVSYAFLALTIHALVANTNAGFYLGLSALSRYASLGLAPLLIFTKPKNIVLSSACFALTLAPWLIYNYAMYGNFFLSIADQYANNIYFRDYIHTPFDFAHLLHATGILLPLALIGLVKKTWTKTDLLLAIIAISTLATYAATPIKDARYLFNILLPLSVWGYQGLATLFKKRKLFAAVALISIISLSIAASTFHQSTANKELYLSTIEQLHTLNLTNCSISSNAWVALAYYGLLAQDFPRQELLNSTIADGELVLLFTHIAEPDYARNTTLLSSYPIIEQTDKYTLLGNGCNLVRKNDKPFIHKLANTIERIHNYRTEERPCNLLLKNPTLINLCYFVNGETHE